MTVMTDALSRATTYDITGEITPLDRPLNADLLRYCDCPYPNSTLDAVDEVQDITVGDRTGGDMDLDFTLIDGQTFSVDAVAFDAAASVVQTALDIAAALVITNYVAGDIAVTGGPFAGGGATTVITFNGSSVRGNHPLLVVDGTNLTGPNEVQALTVGDRTGGTMDLDITLIDTQTVSANALVFNAAASVVQTSIDAAAPISITGYVAGDIAVTGGPFGVGGATTTITFSGASVRGNHALLVVDGTNLTGGTVDPVPSEITAGTVGPVSSEDTAGIVPRFWFAALKAMGVIVGTDPALGATPNGQYTVNTQDTLERYPNEVTIRRLIKEASVQEAEDWETELLPLLNIN